jgi:nucleoid DNA-binding protein
MASAISGALVKDEDPDVQERLVTQDEFYDLLNEKVFIPHLGQELPFTVIKDIVHGMGDVVMEIIHNGDAVRFGKIGTFKLHVTPPGPRWDPTKKENFAGPERKKLAFRQSKSTKRLFTDDS